MVVTAEFRKTSSVIENLANASAGIQRALSIKVLELSIMLEAYIKTSKLSGQVLNVRSGALRRSINHTAPVVTATSVTANVFSDASVKYGAIHEFGGQTRPHDIFPKAGGVLAFTIGGRKVFASVVHHTGSKMPERSFMRTGLADKEAFIREQLRIAVVQGAVGK